MIMKKYLFFAACLMVPFVMSCSDDDIKNDTIPRTDIGLEGRWRLVKVGETDALSHGIVFDFSPDGKVNVENPPKQAIGTTLLFITPGGDMDLNDYYSAFTYQKDDDWRQNVRNNTEEGMISLTNTLLGQTINYKCHVGMKEMELYPYGNNIVTVKPWDKMTFEKEYSLILHNF